MAVGLDAVLEAVELPAGVADLAAGLADVDRDALALEKEEDKIEFFSIFQFLISGLLCFMLGQNIACAGRNYGRALSCQEKSQERSGIVCKLGGLKFDRHTGQHALCA